MRSLLLLIATLSFTGCMTPIPLSYQEYCARKGLVFADVVETSSDGMAMAFIGGRMVPVQSHSTGSNIRCVRVETSHDQCMVQSLSSAAEPKESFNATLNGKKLLIVLGYMAYIVPGAAMHYHFNNQRSGAITEAQILGTSVQGSCPKPTNASAQ